MAAGCQAAGEAAGRVLKQLDALCKALVLVGCLDEIFFHGRAVLVGVEPASMVWFLGKKVGKLRGSVWAEQLQALGRLATRDRRCGQAPASGDRPSSKSNGGNTVKTPWLRPWTSSTPSMRPSRPWPSTGTKWSGTGRLLKRPRSNSNEPDERGSRAGLRPVRPVALWVKVVNSFERYETIEAAWKHAAVALAVFRPDGQLNDRAWAEAQVADALPALVGRAWVKVVNHLRTPESFTFLDRMHAALALIPVSQELRDALVRLWWLRRQRPGKSVKGSVRGAGHVAHLVQQEICQKLDPNWREWYLQVAVVLRGTVRASSAVECMNSVLRMHQARHRTMTQGMLDLKRLYWNTRVFRGGKRKGKCPYEHLGLKLASYDFWDLLKDEFSTST